MVLTLSAAAETTDTNLSLDMQATVSNTLK